MAVPLLTPGLKASLEILHEDGRTGRLACPLQKSACGRATVEAFTGSPGSPVTLDFICSPKAWILPEKPFPGLSPSRFLSPSSTVACEYQPVSNVTSPVVPKSNTEHTLATAAGLRLHLLVPVYR